MQKVHIYNEYLISFPFFHSWRYVDATCASWPASKDSKIQRRKGPVPDKRNISNTEIDKRNTQAKYTDQLVVSLVKLQVPGHSHILLSYRMTIVISKNPLSYRDASRRGMRMPGI